MLNTPAEYEYQALSDASKQIRLLSFTPGQPDDEIHCRCSIHEFDKGHPAPAYNAISYTWGTPSETSTIFVDGQTLTVRQNCRYALWQARRLLATRSEVDGAETAIPFVWIDAICINQSDLAEKGSQVAMMGDVFARANRTLACIGCHADDSDFFLDRAPAELGSHLRNWTRLDVAGRIKLETRVRAGERIETLWSQMFEPSECMRAAASMKTLAQRPYFHRVWVIQELQVSTKVVLCCGASAVNLEVFLNLLTHLEFDAEPMGEIASIPTTGLFWDTWRTIMPLGEDERTLSWLLRVFPNHQCSDWHDAVYALLSLVSDPPDCKDTGCNARNMPPRYDCSPLQFFMQTIPYLGYIGKDLPLEYFWGAHQLLGSLQVPMDNDMRPYLEIRRGAESIRPPFMERKENRTELRQGLHNACMLLERDGDLYIPDADVSYDHCSAAYPTKVACSCQDAYTFVTGGHSSSTKARRILASVDFETSIAHAYECDSSTCAFITSADVKAGDLLVEVPGHGSAGGVFYTIARKKAGTQMFEFIHHAFPVGKCLVDWPPCVMLHARKAFDSKNALVGRFAVEDIMALTYVQHHSDTVEFLREHLETRVCGWQGSSYIEPGPALDEIISRGIAEEHDGVRVGEDDVALQGVAGDR